MKEIWRKIPGTFYSASSFGRIRSDGRRIRYFLPRFGGIWCVRRTQSRIIKCSWPKDRKRYAMTSVTFENGRRKPFGVHQLIALAFIGPCPPGKEVCHNNGNNRNCRPGNIRYDTPKENHKDKQLHGTLLEGEDVATSKLTKSEVKTIRRLAGRGVVQTRLAEKFDVGPMQISRIVRRIQWKSVS